MDRKQTSMAFYKNSFQKKWKTPKYTQRELERERDSVSTGVMIAITKWCIIYKISRVLDNLEENKTLWNIML